MASGTRNSILSFLCSLAALAHSCHAQQSLTNEKVTSSCAKLDGQPAPASESLLQMRHQRNSNAVTKFQDDVSVDRNGQNIDTAMAAHASEAASVQPVGILSNGTEAGLSVISKAPGAVPESLPSSVEIAPAPLVDGTAPFKLAYNAIMYQQLDGIVVSRQTLGTAAFAIFSGLVVLSLMPKDRVESIPEKGRCFLLDNSKIFAQFLVIFSNILFFNLARIDDNSAVGYSDWKTWLSGSADLLHVTLEAFSVVMVPMLCFVSGVLSQGPTTEKRIQRFIECLVVPTLLWIYFVKPVILSTFTDPNVNHLMDRLTAIYKLQSFQEEWYLQALVLWRLSAFLFWSHLHPSISLICMLVLSGVAGYMNLNGPLWYLKLDEALGFLPYFGIGYVFPFESVKKACNQRPVPTIIALALAILWVFGITGYAGPLPDSHGNYQCCAAGSEFKATQGLDYSLYWTRRLARVALELPPTLLLIFFVIPQRETSISWVGPYTIYPFLFHQVANYWRNQFFQFFQPPLVGHTAGHITILILHVPYVLGVLVFFASRPWRMMFKWCFEPVWIRSFLKNEQDGKQNRAPEATKMLFSTGSLLPYPSTDRSTSDEAQHQSIEYDDCANPMKFRGLTMQDLYDSRQPEVDEEDEDDNASEESTPEVLPPCRTHLGSWQSTGPPIPWQAEALKYYPWLLPGFLITIAICIFPFVIFQAYFGMEFLIGILDMVPLGLVAFFFPAGLVMMNVSYIYHYYRLRGTDQVPEPADADPLTHVVVLVAYKEPMDVLERSVSSIAAQRGVRNKPIFLLASENRDMHAQGQFDALKKRFNDSFEQMIITKHVLADGETQGKSSNENWAVQELYRMLVEEQALDPFEVMVTIVDADSVVSRTYLAYLEKQFRDMRDGRRLVYSGPLNIHRNFADACLLAQAIDLHRCHGDTFYDPFGEVHPQSNYSLTLGLAQEIGFWTPDVMAEDIHVSNRTMVHNFGSRTTVSIPSFICNDLVTDFGDRYVQAKRHQWGGLAEFAWILSLLFDMRLSIPNWLQVVRKEVSREGGVMDTACRTAGYVVTVAVFTLLYYVHWSQHSWKVKLYLGLGVVGMFCQYVLYWIVECTLWQTLLKQFPIKRPSYFRWTLLVCLLPVLLLVSRLIFVIGATFHCLILMATTTNKDIRYIVAPKGDGQKSAAVQYTQPKGKQLGKTSW